MRTPQVLLFVLGVACFLVSATAIGSVAGGALWRAGVAAMLTTTAAVLLWPARRVPHSRDERPDGVADTGMTGPPARLFQAGAARRRPVRDGAWAARREACTRWRAPTGGCAATA
jgi:membrane protein implicated in regulation of membrane protease activity